ncbi:MAG TPA: zinc-binding alcohol dehydrogenase family protein [Cyclobacteriaceae bacterium]|jgi:2-desacetyl-2-hydroxyethyl bacteriochlorophyllide A dehydrogenase|nr:MAG: alcohol dehydrogenase [Bacteroidota bacterium]
MDALICESPGTLRYATRNAPVAGENETMLRVRRIGICGTDLHAFEGTQPYFTYPRILGHELAGEIVEVNGTHAFKKGDIVTFLPYFNCGRCIACRQGKTNCCTDLKVCGVHVDGGMVDYLVVPTANLVASRGIGLDALALVEPLAIGAHGIDRAEVKTGDFVLVIGAGPIGMGAMQFARLAGAEVIALDLDERRLAFCRERLGVHYTIASKEDVLARLRDITSGDMPSVVIDATGNLNAINEGFRYMSHGGRYVLIGLQKGDITFSHPEFHKREGTLMSSRNATRKDFDQVIRAISEGRVDPESYITHRVAFAAAGEAFPSWLNRKSGVIKAMVMRD